MTIHHCHSNLNTSRPWSTGAPAWQNWKALDTVQVSKSGYSKVKQDSRHRPMASILMHMCTLTHRYA